MIRSVQILVYNVYFHVYADVNELEFCELYFVLVHPLLLIFEITRVILPEVAHFPSVSFLFFMLYLALNLEAFLAVEIQ